MPIFSRLSRGRFCYFYLQDDRKKRKRKHTKKEKTERHQHVKGHKKVVSVKQMATFQEIKEQKL